MTANMLPTKAEDTKNSARRNQAGVSLLEAIIAIMILTIGLVSVAGAVAYAMQLNTFNRYTTEGKMIGLSMIEQVETLRNTRQLTYNQINNYDNPDFQNPPVGQGTQFDGFPSDFRPVSPEPGADGVFGTIDDVGAVQNPQYTRRILISRVTSTDPSLKRIDVTVRYPRVDGKMHELTVTSYLYNQGN